MEKKYLNEIVEATISDIQIKFENDELTSFELVLMYLSRIAKYDQDGPHINSVLEINPDALHIAQALDVERRQKGSRGPLHGIPVIIKDNIDTHDKMHTSAGSKALENSVAKHDAHIVKKLREAGAIILGKANMTEWANFMTSNMPSGYSSRGGQVLNPYGPGKHDVGGSSSGSGASVSSNFTMVAVGTETSGSILSPASQNSIVGIKPTIGLVSRSGIVPISHSQDTAGPMARTVTGAAILLNVLASRDDLDPITLSNDDTIDYTTFLDKDGLKGMRIGVGRAGVFEHLSEDKKQIMENAITKMKELGAEVIDSVELPKHDIEWSIDVLIYEFKAALNAYLNHLDPSIPIRSLKDVIEYNKAHEETMLKYGQTLLEASEATSGRLTESKYLQELEKDIYYSREAGIDQLLKDKGLDAIIFPNNFGAFIPAKAGYPSITVPAGYTKDNEPVGVTFTGTAFSEGILIKMAYAYEQATNMRIPPKLD